MDIDADRLCQVEGAFRGCSQLPHGRHADGLAPKPMNAQRFYNYFSML
jgi:hypothetical protein